MNCKDDDRMNSKLFFFLNVSFENALVIKERKLNYLKKHVLIERNVVLIFNRFI